MRLGQLIVELKRLPDSGFRLWFSILRGNDLIVWEKHVSAAQSSISKRVIGITVDSLLKIIGCFLQMLRGALIPFVAAFQIQLVRLRVLRSRTRNTLTLIGAEPQL